MIVMDAPHWTGDDNRDELTQHGSQNLHRNDYYLRLAQRLDVDLRAAIEQRDLLAAELKEVRSRNRILEDRLARLINGDAA